MGASNQERLISDRVNDLMRNRSGLKMLEAGCGSASYFDFARVQHIVGIDICPDQLKNNRVLQEKILGDLQTYPLPLKEFDIVVCWDVLEHLPNPRNALENMFKSAKNGGVVVLGFPNLLSFKGIVTKLTPFWFHELFYRWMNYRSRHFPTYLRTDILPSRVVKFAVNNGFEVILDRRVEGGVTKKFKQRSRLIPLSLQAADAVVRMISFGKCESLHNDNCAIILLKQT